MIIEQWAKLWGVSDDALRHLYSMIYQCTPNPVVNADGNQGSESFVQSQVRLALSYAGGRAWRNNVGALIDERGIPVRYGLANDTKAMNKVCKSSDLIGIKPIIITDDMVGLKIGQFWARECKHAGWKPGADKKRETAQMNFINLVNAMGGDAAFTNGLDLKHNDS